MTFRPMDPNVTKQILEVAKKHLLERGWTQSAYARDEAGNKVMIAQLVLYESMCPPPAASYCALGAVYSSQEVLANPVFHILETTRYLQGLVEDEPLAEWNDAPERTKEEVVALFDRAITTLSCSSNIE